MCSFLWMIPSVRSTFLNARLLLNKLNLMFCEMVFRVWGRRGRGGGGGIQRGNSLMEFGDQCGTRGVSFRRGALIQIEASLRVSKLLHKEPPPYEDVFRSLEVGGGGGMEFP